MTAEEIETREENRQWGVGSTEREREGEETDMAAFENHDGGKQLRIKLV